MEIDLAWLLVLPLLFAMGWIMARYDARQQKKESMHVPKDLLDGVSAILSDDLVKATDSFLSAARSAPDAADLHRAVGNVYRRRGMTDRAIEVHETALRNPALTPAERELFLLDLGRDFVAAGIFDRAEHVLNELRSTALAGPAQMLLLQVAQTTRNWAAAIDCVREISAQPSRLKPHHPDQLLAHFHCELAQAASSRGEQDQATALLAQAAVSAQKAFEAGIAGPKARVDAMQATESISTSLPAGLSVCRVCGFRSKHRAWQCPACHHWDCFE
jgi:lipopolysaccharide assembly protein B